MFFLQKTSRLAGGLNFVGIDLKLSVKVGTIFLRLRRYYFSFKFDFLEAKKMSSASATRRRVGGLLISDRAAC